MGSLYRAKLLRRFAYGMARPVFWCCVCGATFLGLALGWILFAEPHRLGDASIGTVSDVASAIAAWVIGIAAAWYAKQAYDLRNREVAEQKMQAIRAAMQRLIASSTKALLCRFLAGRVLMAEDVVIGERTTEELLVYLNSALNKAADVQWSEAEKSVIHPTLLAKIVVIEFDTRVLTEYVQLAVNRLNSHPADANAPDLLTAAVQAAHELQASVQDALDEVLRARQTLADNMPRHFDPLALAP